MSIAVERAKAILGISDSTKDSLLGELICQAENEAVNYTHNDPVYLQDVIVWMATYNFKRLDSMEVQSENYSGVSFNYSTDYPASIMRELKSKRKVVVV